MNADTGRMYFTPEEVAEAQARGERLVPLDRENIDRVVQEGRAGRERGPVVPLTKGQFRRRGINTK